MLLQQMTLLAKVLFCLLEGVRTAWIWWELCLVLCQRFCFCLLGGSLPFLLVSHQVGVLVVVFGVTLWTSMDKQGQTIAYLTRLCIVLLDYLHPSVSVSVSVSEPELSGSPSSPTYSYT